MVIGLDCITGLQTARILAARGVPVLGLASDPRHYCARTRAVQEVVTLPSEGEGLVAALEDLAGRLPDGAVLYPCTDGAVLAISRGRDRLKERYRYALPSEEVVEALADKAGFAAFAEEHGLPVPATLTIRSADEARQAAGLRFPCVVKPRVKSALWEDTVGGKVVRVDTPSDWLALYERVAALEGTLVIQEWIEGGDDCLYSCNVYFDAQGCPLVTFVARKLRQWPPGRGTSCLGEEVRDDVVLDTTVRLFQTAEYHGLGYVEMKRDAVSGRYVVIEPNVGRPTGRSAIAENAGVELIYTMYCDLTGLPLPTNRFQRYGTTKWVYLRRDLQSAVHYWRRGELSLRQWLRSWRGLRSDAVFSWRDQGPFWSDLAGSAGEALRTLRRRPRRSA